MLVLFYLALWSPYLREGACRFAARLLVCPHVVSFRAALPNGARGLGPEEGCNLWLWRSLKIFSLLSYSTKVAKALSMQARNYRCFSWNCKFMKQEGFLIFFLSLLLIIIITLFQEDNIFGTNSSLTYGPQLQYLWCEKMLPNRI